MKKKVLFMIINMNVGGTEKALLNMIAEMPKEKYEITILMLEKYGGFLDFIPRHVHVEYLQEYTNIKGQLNNPPKDTVYRLIKKGNFLKCFTFLTAIIFSKWLKNKNILMNYILIKVPSRKIEYDIAVAYAGPMDLISYFVIHKIKAKKKVQWIHFDITKIGFNKPFASKLYKQFDKLFVVSNEAKDKLLRALPELDCKTEVFKNMVSPNIICSQSKSGKGFNEKFEGLRILTVGRLSLEKGQDMAIRVLARLKEDGYKVKWYSLGEGNYRSKYEQLIDQHKLHNDFILLGSNPNPYPYMEQCDLYVQPSRYEGYCITVLEARCLGKPIISTDVNGAREQIEDGKTGLVVGISEEEIYSAIVKLISNKDLRRLFTQNLSKEKFDENVKHINYISQINDFF